MSDEFAMSTYWSKFDTPAQARTRAILDAELQEQRAAKAAVEAPLQARCNALEARINRLEAAAVGGFNGVPDEFWDGLGDLIREFVDKKCAPLLQKIKTLEDRPQLKYCGIWTAGNTYQENSLVTRDGSLWIAKRNTAAYPGGGAEPDISGNCA